MADLVARAAQVPVNSQREVSHIGRRANVVPSACVSRSRRLADTLQATNWRVISFDFTSAHCPWPDELFATKAEAKAEADRRIALQPAWQMTFVAEWPA